jgi:hypothetical protein
MISKKRAFIQISFTWIFAFIVGAFILFIAIFALTKFINTEKQTSDLSSAKDVSVLLDPLETSFEQGKITSLATPTPTRIYSECGNENFFGYQGIKFNQEIYNKWTETNDSVNSQNKYLFMENPQEGRVFYIFSKPFNFPFKVASLIYITSEEETFCFKNAPNVVEEEIENLKHPGIFLEENQDEKLDCSGEEKINVCFETYGVSGCDVKVTLNQEKGFVTKDGKTLYFPLPKSGIKDKDYSLMYAAIFSDPSLYECQSQRLIDRTISLSLVYQQKLLLPSLEGCNSDLIGNLGNFINELESFQKSENFGILVGDANDIWSKNKYTPSCRLW